MRIIGFTPLLLGFKHPINQNNSISMHKHIINTPST